MGAGDSSPVNEGTGGLDLPLSRARTWRSLRGLASNRWPPFFLPPRRCAIFLTDVWAGVPGLTSARETYEAGIYWGQASALVFTAGYLNANAIDSGNSPTWELRPGLVLGQSIGSGQWTNYSPTATDGSEVAAGVLITAIRMQDLQGTNQARFYGIIVGGRVQSTKLLGLDLMARQQMDKFQFDDSPGGWYGKHWYPYARFQTKTANYPIVATDNLSVFNNLGASAEVDFTLPAIANGYFFGFNCEVDQTLKVISTEGSNMITFNNASANSVAFSTGGSRIGGSFRIYSNPAATKWIVEALGSNTVTVA